MVFIMVNFNPTRFKEADQALAASLWEKHVTSEERESGKAFILIEVAIRELGKYKLPDGSKSKLIDEALNDVRLLQNEEIDHKAGDIFQKVFKPFQKELCHTENIETVVPEGSSQKPTMDPGKIPYDQCGLAQYKGKPEVEKFAQHLWDKYITAEEAAADPDKCYLLIARGIEMRGQIGPKLFDKDQFDHGFKLMKALSIVSLKRESVSDTIINRVLLEKEFNAQKIGALDNKKFRTLSPAVQRLVRKTFLGIMETAHGKYDKSLDQRQEYKAGKLLGKGIYKRVYQYVTSGSFFKSFVIKKQTEDKDSESDIKSEAEFYEKFSQMATPSETKKLIPEFAYERGALIESEALGKLWDFLKKLSLEEKMEVASQLLEQMAILARYGVIYTDIKPDNILIISTKPIKVRLSDFGHTPFASEKKIEMAYSPQYIAKEDMKAFKKALRSQSEKNISDAAQRIQSSALGMVLCYMFSGVNPEGYCVAYDDGFKVKDLGHYYRALDKQENFLKINKDNRLILVDLLNGKGPENAWNKWNDLNIKERFNLNP